MSKDKTATITLDYPIQLADRLLTEVTMRRPTVDDLLAHPVKSGGDILGEVKLFAILCHLSPDDIRLFDMEDYDQLVKCFLSFRKIADEA